MWLQQLFVFGGTRCQMFWLCVESPGIWDLLFFRSQGHCPFLVPIRGIGVPLIGSARQELRVAASLPEKHLTKVIWVQRKVLPFKSQGHVGGALCFSCACFTNHLTQSKTSISTWLVITQLWTYRGHHLSQWVMASEKVVQCAEIKQICVWSWLCPLEAGGT